MPKLRVIIKPPPEPTGDAERDVENQRDYLLQMSEELAYVLTHLEADNINDSTFERIQEMIPKAYTGLPPMDGEASSGGTNAWSRGDHRHPHDSSKADADDLADHVGDTANPHGVTKTQVGLENVANERQYSAENPPPTPSAAEVGAIPVTDKGNAGGVAELDANGMVPSAQLPSYVDDVLEYASSSAFPATGESGKIYVALDTNLTYRWSGSAYVEISQSLALGETASTAYRGDRGKMAYDHSQVTSGNPHNVTAAEVGLGNVANERQYSAQNPPPLPTPADIGAATAQDLTDHVGDTNNPHSVTAAQAGARPDTWTPTASDVGARPDDWVPDAEDVPYDNTDSGLTATNVQDAIDEVYGDIPTQPSDIGAQDEITANGILKGDGQGGVSAATAGTDYAPANHASSATTYGKGDASNYGHLKLSNSTSLNSGVVDGIAATPKAVKDTYDFAATKAEANSYTGTFASSSTTYVSSASVSDCKRAGMLVGLALTLSLAAQIPISRQTFGQLHGVPTPKAGAVGVMQIVNALFAVTITASGELQIEAIGAAGGGSGWSGQVTIMYITDGTILA